MKIIDLHERPFTNLLLNIVAFGTLYTPLLLFFDEIIKWSINVFEAESMLGKWLAAEAGAMLAWVIVVSGLFTLLYLAWLFQNAMKSLKKVDEEED